MRRCWSKYIFKQLMFHQLRNGSEQLLDVANVLLRLAWNETGEGNDELTKSDFMEVVCELILKSSKYYLTKVCIPDQPQILCSKWYFLKGRQLLSRLNKCEWICFCIGIKICKRLFKTALEVQDEYSESIYTMTNLYLTALHSLMQNKDKCLTHGRAAMLNAWRMWEPRFRTLCTRLFRSRLYWWFRQSLWYSSACQVCGSRTIIMLIRHCLSRTTEFLSYLRQITC